MSSPRVITDLEFEQEVLKADQPVLVYFWASWCGPCRLMSPLIDGVATNYADRLKVFKMEVDPNPDSVAQCKVEGVPALRFFQDGALKETSEGAISKQKLEAFLSQCLEN